jgi:hypothetical protein
VRYVLDFDLTSKFNSTGNRELEEFCRPLRMLGHGNKEVFAPTRHAWLLRRDNGFTPEKKTRLLLLDHKVFQSARLYYFTYRWRLHETKVSNDSEKPMRKIFDFDTRASLDVWYAIGNDCEYNIALV